MRKPNRAAVVRAGRAITEGAGGLLPPRGRRGAIVFAPATPGSEGDTLLVHGLARLLAPPARVAVSSSSERWGSADVDVRARDLLGRATRFARGDDRRSRAVAAAATRGWDRAWFIGADVIDGAYGTVHLRVLDWLDLFVLGGCVTGVCGFSFRESPDPGAVSRLQATREGVLFVARGPVSAARFERTVGRPCRAGPDLSWAVLTEEYERGAADLDPAPASTIGCNLAPQVAQSAGVDHLTGVVARVMGDHRRAGAAVELLPHDPRGSASDVALLAQLAERIGVPRSAVTMTDGPSLRRRVRRCAMVLSCRMHLSISALAFGVPVVALGYHDKFDDLTSDPTLARYLRIVDPAGDDLEDRIRAASDELRAQGRMPAEVLRDLHERKRAELAALATTLATGAPPLGGC